MTRTSRRGSNTVRTHRHRERAAGHGGAVLQPAALGLLSRCLEPNSRCHCLTLIPTMPSSSWGSIRDRTPHVPAHVRGPNNQVRACGWHTMHKWFHTYSPACCASHQLMRCYQGEMRTRVLLTANGERTQWCAPPRPPIALSHLHVYVYFFAAYRQAIPREC